MAENDQEPNVSSGGWVYETKGPRFESWWARQLNLLPPDGKTIQNC